MLTIALRRIERWTSNLARVNISIYFTQGSEMSHVLALILVPPLQSAQFIKIFWYIWYAVLTSYPLFTIQRQYSSYCFSWYLLHKGAEIEHECLKCGKYYFFTLNIQLSKIVRMSSMLNLDREKYNFSKKEVPPFVKIYFSS